MNDRRHSLPYILKSIFIPYGDFIGVHREPREAAAVHTDTLYISSDF